MTKRQRFVITSALLSLGFVGVQFLPTQYRFLSIGLLGVFTLTLFIFSLQEGLGSDMTLLSLILPFFYTIGVGLFWFLLPSNLLARFPVVILYGFGIYALCLTANIYTVAAIRTIALLRAARGVGFVLTLLTFFLAFDAILSVRWPIYFTSAAILIVSIPLFLQGFWSTVLEKEFRLDLAKYSLISSLVLMEITLALFFWPTTVVVGSLFLTVSSYTLLGLGQAKLEGRLFSQTVREYLTVALLVFLGMFFVTQWGQ